MDWDRLTLRLNHGFGRIRCPEGWSLRPGWGWTLADCDFWLVWAGRGWMKLGQRRIRLRPGVCLWMRPGVRDYEAQQEPSDRLGVTFCHFDLLDSDGQPIREHDRLPAEAHEVSDLSLFEAVARRVIELRMAAALRDEDEGGPTQRLARTLLKGLLMELEAGPLEEEQPTLSGTQRLHHEMALRAAAQISEDPASLPSMAELARRSGYSPDHFGRIFRRVIGMSPQAYAVEARVDRARRLLSESAMSVGQIAAALGYADVHFFSRQFKSKTGRSPRDYRQRPGP
jgi:AraC-like DNA-binding protein